MKKLLTVAAVAFVIYWAATAPDSASSAGMGVLDWLKQGGEGLARFASDLAAHLS